jgi:hypothetical protein
MGKTSLWAVTAAFTLGCSPAEDVTAYNAMNAHVQAKRAAYDAEYMATMADAQRAEAQRSQDQERADRESERRNAANREVANRGPVDPRETQKEAFCAQDRPERLADTQRLLREHVSWVKSEKERLAYFDAHCEIYDSRGLKISRERVSDGVIVRSRQVGEERDVKCDGTPGRPKGIDARWLKTIEDRMNDSPTTGTSVHCALLDERALGASLVVSYSDPDQIKRVLAITPL